MPRRSDNRVELFLSEVAGRPDLDDLLELAVVNSPVYRYVPKIILPRAATIPEVAISLDRLFAARMQRARVEALEWEARERIPDLPQRNREVRERSRRLIADRLELEPEDFIILADVMRVNHGRDSRFWEPLRRTYNVYIREMLRAQQPARLFPYIEAIETVCRNARTHRFTMAKYPPPRELIDFEETFRRSIQDVRLRFGYE